MKSSIYLLLFTLIINLSTLFAQRFEESYKLGIILPLSGKNAFGVGIQKGCLMALHDINQKRKKIKIIFEDDQYEPFKTISALRKILINNRIDALITVSTGPTQAILPIIDKEKIPLLAIATDNGFTKRSSFAFSFWIPPKVEAYGLASEAISRGYKKIVRVTSLNPVFHELNKHFDLAIKNKIEILIDEQYDPNENDFKSIISRIKSIKSLDAILVNLLPAAAGNFTKQARVSGLKQDFFATEVFESSEAIRLSKGALEGQWFASNASSESNFEKRFKKLYPNESIIGAPNCYDAINLIYAGLSNGKDNLVKYLSTIKNYNGIMGKFSSLDNGGFSLPVAIKVVKDNYYKQLKIVELDKSPTLYKFNRIE